MPKLIIKSLLVYSTKIDNHFFTDFDEKINIIHGKKYFWQKYAYTIYFIFDGNK